MDTAIAREALTLGVLAGGQGTRLGGCAKAWIVRDGMTQVERLVRRFERDVAHVLVSANRDAVRFESLGLAVVADRVPDQGPLGGLEALAAACTTPWLLTVPVDLVFVNDCLVSTLSSAGKTGASVEDEDGPQPLVALWNVATLRTALRSEAAVIPAKAGIHDLSVQGLQSRLHMPRIRLPGVRLGNLNTFDDLANAGARLPDA
jgi:molybdopterin-guanine dinucleotide biosynthesis protein A